MAKKIRRVRTFARTASKSMEKRLVDNAKALKKDPHLALPEYKDNYSKKYIGKLTKNFDKVHRFCDDAKRLEKLSNKRGLDGALAGTLLIAHSEKAPYLAVAKFSMGDVTYAQRGKSDKEKLIAIQHFDDPILRLLGIKDIALKKKLHVYSWPGGFFSTGLEANPPEDFINFVMKKTSFSYKNKIAVCEHIDEEILRNKKPLKKYYLSIQWKSANVLVGICEDCAKSTKNTLFNITKYLIEPDISKDFGIDVVGQEIKKDESEQLTLYVDEYLSGKLNDINLIKKNKEQRQKSIKESKEKVLILDGDSYGKDVNGFIEALKPNKFEKKGLEFIIEQLEEPVILNDVTPNKVLELFWKEHGLNAINSIIDDKEMAEKFFDLNDTPSDILEVVFKYNERRQILSRLPRYKYLPPLANFADNIARIYKTFGEKKTLMEIKKRPDNPKGKSLAYAFLLVLGKGEDKKWGYSQVEIEYGEFLKDYAKKLLESKPEGYHKALQELLIASGSSENIDNL
ncbi:MAG: hypothetical protein JSW62_00295 [Thermoplasmatales archaeon]|nr:MAG: hypothetical protein JSW62_00295 [Thermoplasmatales archaeon]